MLLSLKCGNLASHVAQLWGTGMISKGQNITKEE